MSTITRKTFMAKVGADMTNPRWSWVGVNKIKRQVFFTTWSHYKNPENSKEYLIYADYWINKTEAPNKDAKKGLRLVIEDGYEACLVFADAHQKFSYPMALNDEDVSIEKLRASFYMKAKLRFENGECFAVPTNRVEVI